jgi:hypothetical protein
MTCLTDGEVQALVDGEAGAGEQAHAAACESCAARVREQRRRVEALLKAVGGEPVVPAGLESRVRGALEGDSHVRGATTLRGETPQAGGWRRLGWRAALAAAAALIAIVVVAPMIGGPATVSASEVLNKSLQALSRPAATGVERLEYELTLDGIPREFMPVPASGTYRIEELIDRDHAGRYRMSTFDAEGRIVSAVSEDPAAGRRTSVMLVDGRPFVFDFKTAAAPALSLLELERTHMEASVTMMQASGDQKLTEVADASGKSYLIQIPRVSPTRTEAVWDLQEARVLIDAEDFRIKEFSARGTILKQPYSVSYRLIRREARAAGEVAAAEFEIPSEPEAIVLTGRGTANPARDVVIAALREVARTRE